jgi:hypothetical protein
MRKAMIETTQIKEHMNVAGADDEKVGTVDCVRGDEIILTKSDPESGGKHHSFPKDWIDSIGENEIRLNKTAEQARANWFDAEKEKADAAKPCP